MGLKKIIYILLLSLSPVFLFAQQTITVVSNVKVSFSEKRGTYRWYRPVFSHEGNTLSADSADFNPGDSFFDAFGNVVITQPNGTVAYADKLHYTESTQEAILTNNVRLVDQEAVLTTNHLTYNMKSKIGTYKNGGRIINKKDTLTSKNGYYFENTQDAYFRYNVVVKTPDVKIQTDTLRYNSGSKTTYFYGPSTIDGKNGRLYTENGEYNTESDNARFGKNNLYTEGSKFLWGDSLYYDGASGNGRAVKNVSFVDTAQNVVMRGQLGTYTKATEATMVTDKAYIVFATKSDSTEASSDSLNILSQNSIDSTSRDSASLTHSQEIVGQPRTLDSLKLKNPVQQADTLLGNNDSTLTVALPDDSLSVSKQDTAKLVIDTIPKENIGKMDSTYLSADTLYSQVIKLRDYSYANLKISRDGGALEIDDDDSSPSSDENPPLLKDSDQQNGDTSLLLLDSTKMDSLQQLNGADTLKTDSIRIEHPSISEVKDNLIDTLQTDSLGKPSEIKVKNEEAVIATLDSAKRITEPLRQLTAEQQKAIVTKVEKAASNQLTMQIDTNFIAPKKGEVDSLTKKAMQVALTKNQSDSLSSDTTETRIIKAFHDVRIFKSDLQAIADSAYFGYPDSILRCFGKPIVWAQGSQLSSDTLYLQLKNQKMDNMLLKNNAFVVNTELDSTKYNQVKGKKISSFFKNDQMERVFVDGNAESIYYMVEDNQYSGMARSISGRIKVLFEDNKMTNVISISKPSTTYYPILKTPTDEEFIDGFIWRPELRPKSKEEVINRSHTTRKEIDDQKLKEEEEALLKDNPEKPNEVKDKENTPEKEVLKTDEKKNAKNEEAVNKNNEEEEEESEETETKQLNTESLPKKEAA